MRKRHWFVGLALAAALQACSLPADPTTPTLAGPTSGPPAELPTQRPEMIPTLPLPTDIPIITVTPGPPIASPIKYPVNCRFGPGTVYSVVDEIKENQSARIAGRNEAGTWWYVRDPGNPGGFCWLAADLTEVTGDTSALSVIPPPVPFVTKIDLVVDPARMVIGCNQFPQNVFFSGEITVNGPALVTYRWEVSTGVSSMDNAIVFEEAGSKTIHDYYQIGSPNDYWIRLHILGPNDASEQAYFFVICN